MRLENYVSYGMCLYDNHISKNDTFKLGDVVINNDDEIGVIIQVHSPLEFRTDMFGNTSDEEVRLATDTEIAAYRPNILQEGNFDHSMPDELIQKAKNICHNAV